MTTLPRSLAVALVAVVAQGCVEPDAISYGEVASEVTVSAYVSSGCSTAVVIGLSRQIADEVVCARPESLTSFTPGGNLTITSNAVLPYLAPAAKAALTQVTGAYTIQVNSGFRTVAQQYLLYRWYQQGRCGITAAASPGRSNHQSGRALDVANYATRITPMGNAGWSRIPNDLVHFEHLASPDIRGEDVRAFQRLWNRNHPGDAIAEDGLYGPQTEARLRMAPATGFPLGAACAPEVDAGGGVRVVSIDGPDRVAPSSHATYSITVQNTGTAAWPAATRLMVADGTPSALYDSSSWTSPTEVGPINTTIAGGAQGVIDVEVETPPVTEETPMFVQLALTNGTAQLGTIDVALTAAPNGDPEQSGEAGDQHDHDDGDDDHDAAADIHVTGGCNAGSSSSGFGALLGPSVLALLRRRRR